MPGPSLLKPQKSSETNHFDKNGNDELISPLSNKNDVSQVISTIQRKDPYSNFGDAATLKLHEHDTSMQETIEQIGGNERTNQ